MAEKLVVTENNEFHVLVERMQDINRRLEKDTTFLLREKENEDKKIEDEEKKVKLVRERNLKNRRQAKKEKEEWLGKKKEAIETTDHQRDDAGKFSQSANIMRSPCSFLTYYRC